MKSKAKKPSARPFVSKAPVTETPVTETPVSDTPIAKPSEIKSSQPKPSTSTKSPAKPENQENPIAALPDSETQARELVAPAPQIAPASASGKKTPKPSRDVLGLETVAEKTTTPAVDQAIKENLTKKPAGSLQSDIRIFQIYYEAWHRELLDPAFASLDNANANSELLEFDVFRRLASSDYVKEAKLWGALSWRFAEKTGMSGQDLLKTILSNPGHDVYFCNPVPENEALYHNLWLQGATAHPQFIALVEALFRAAELPLEALIGIESDDTCSAANYFVATPQFWALYLPWVQNVLTQANKKLPPQIRDLIHSSLADDRGLHGGATYVPFIVERLFPVFMRLHQGRVKGFKVALPERDRELNVHLKLLKEMKEIAHKTKSAWLAACWVNYRNLYLTQIKGKAWCQQNLANITPKEIRFL